jgi:hypothetical protein
VAGFCFGFCFCFVLFLFSDNGGYRTVDGVVLGCSDVLRFPQLDGVVDDGEAQFEVRLPDLLLRTGRRSKADGDAVEARVWFFRF